VLSWGNVATQAPDEGDLFAVLRAAPQGELPACDLDALDGLDRRRFVRDDCFSWSA
jgi:hypothetical protein